MLWSLMDSSPKSAEELATAVGLSTASTHAHLARLTNAGLLRFETRAGLRRFRMAAPDVQAAIDALACTALACAARRAPRASTPLLISPPALRQARLCHGHLGGELGAGLYQQLMAAGWIERHEPRIEVTPKGAQQLATLGIFTQALAAPLVCDCFDWTLQQPHLGGALGAGLLQLFLQSNWLSAGNDARALVVSAIGRQHIPRLAVPEPH